MAQAALEEGKIFNDPVHGTIHLNPICVKIIDTPQFQRLRFVKQLGTCDFVYPGATHNRFEHSLGVCYLAGLLARTLRDKQPTLGIDDSDIRCVEIAGLCHDLGHGPFSHLFQDKFIKRYHEDWKREEASAMMFQSLLDDAGNDLKTLLNQEERNFIVDLINGEPKHPIENQSSGSRGNKAFLYEIVNNKRNGIDVDKFDYLARDCHMIGMKNDFDHKRCIALSRVLAVEDRLEICYRDKEVHNLCNLFYVRCKLHKQVYQHPTKNIVEDMIAEALHQANDHFMIESHRCRMSEAVKNGNEDAFVQLTDAVILQILGTTDDNLKDSRNMLKNVQKRRLYKNLGQVSINQSSLKETDLEKLKEEMSKHDETKTIKKEDIAMKFVVIGSGMRVDEDPIKNVRFYSKHAQNTHFTIAREQVSHMIQEQAFSEKLLQVFCKKKESLHAMKDAFKRLCEEKQYTIMF